MKTHEHAQGSPEWAERRIRARNASEAPAMMGASEKVKRNELLAVKATGAEREISDYVREVVFERGNEVEAIARPFAEEYIGQELFPVSGSSDDGYLSASFDGLTMDESVIWECKQWNAEKAVHVRAGRVPPEDYWQCVHQTGVCESAERLVYTLTDGTKAGTIHCDMVPCAQAKQKLRASWAQFDVDVAEFRPAAPVVAAVGRAPETLPALRIEITGMVTASNLAQFKARALEVFDNISTDLQTDQDFADADKTVKWCGDIEERLAAAKQHALSQTATIDDLFRTIDEISEQARTKRLALGRLVEARKQAIRVEIAQQAKDALAEHLQVMNASLGGCAVQAPAFVTDLATAMKGKKTVTSLRDGADTALATAKIAASQQADKIRLNIQILDAAGNASLFADRVQICTSKSPDDLRNLVATRIAQHEAAEKARLEAERARIREEEERRAQQDAERKAEFERARIRQEEEHKARQEQDRRAEADRARIRQEEADKLRQEQAQAKAQEPPPPPAPIASGKGKKAATIERASLPPALPGRPTDAQILFVVAHHFRVDQAVAVQWLRTMDLDNVMAA